MRRLRPQGVAREPGAQVQLCKMLGVASILREREVPVKSPGPPFPAEKIAIELSKPEDYERVADLARQLGYACTRGDVQSRIREMVDSKQHAIYVARLANGLVAGWVGGYVFRSVETESTVEVSGLVVDERIRSRGIGKALLKAIERWARNTGCGSVEVRFNIVRKDAHRFYLKNG